MPAHLSVCLPVSVSVHCHPINRLHPESAGLQPASIVCARQKLQLEYLQTLKPKNIDIDVHFFVGVLMAETLSKHWISVLLLFPLVCHQIKIRRILNMSQSKVLCNSGNVRTTLRGVRPSTYSLSRTPLLHPPCSQP